MRRHTSARFRLAVYQTGWAAFDGLARALFCVFGLPLLYVLEPLAPLRIGELRVDHIGHLAIEPELLLRQLQLDGAGRATRLFLVHGAPSNRQLLDMWKRRLNVVAIRSRFLWRAFASVKPVLARTGFDQPFSGTTSGWEGGERCHEVLSGGEPQLAFTPEEESRGQAELRRMGLPEGAWFVGFHGRDPAYYEALSGYTKRYTREFRDMSIDTMFEAMQWIAASGGYAIRMGAVVERPLPDLGPRVIDYATHFRSDFMDIYLCAKARFFIGSNSGLASVAQIFDVPIACSNVFPYRTVPSGKGAIYLRMLLRDRHTGAMLTFPDIKRRGLLRCPPNLGLTQQYYDDRGLDIVHNDAGDIKDLCVDMLDQLEGRQPSPEAVRLRDRYRLLYDGVDRRPDAGQIGCRFALRYAHLVEPEHVPASNETAGMEMSR